MTISDLAREAIRALVGHRLRAALSSIGIVFGVATVITAYAIGEGAKRAAIAEIGALGVDNILIRAARPQERPGARGRVVAPRLTLRDAVALRQSVGHVRAVASLRTSRAEVRSEAATRLGPATTPGSVTISEVERATAPIIGATAAWDEVMGLSISSGRWLIDRDIQLRRRVVILGPAVAGALFRGVAPLGQRVLVGGDWCVVVGVLAGRGSPAQRGSAVQHVDVDHAAIVPLPIMDARLGTGDAIDRVEEIAIRLEDQDAVDAAAPIVAATMDRRHAGRPDGYEIIVPRELLRARLRAQRTFDFVLLAIGSLALMISGVGIMNIMLASVAERTGEVGVRRAFGARRREIVAQFALEAGVLCMAGGVAGIAVGLVFTAIVGFAAGWPVAISPTAVATALGLAASVGLVFGVYPARLAAALDPAAALRAEY